MKLDTLHVFFESIHTCKYFYIFAIQSTSLSLTTALFFIKFFSLFLLYFFFYVFIRLKPIVAVVLLLLSFTCVLNECDVLNYIRNALPFNCPLFYIVMVCVCIYITLFNCFIDYENIAFFILLLTCVDSL